jgi:hypothetical protein
MAVDPTMVKPQNVDGDVFSLAKSNVDVRCAFTDKKNKELLTG